MSAVDDAGRLILRQLTVRAETAEKIRWNHTASLLAEIMNGPRARLDRRPWAPTDLHPLQEPPAPQVIPPRELVETLRALWM